MHRDKKNRIFIFDFLRVVAISGVIFIHLSGWFLILGAKPKGLYLLLANFSRFAVPMFVFIAAALFFIQYQDRDVKVREYYPKRIKKIFIPYFIVSTIYYIYRMTPAVSSKQVIIFTGWHNLTDFISKLFTIGVFSHLYFVPLIIMFYFMAPYLLKLYKKNKFLTVGMLLGINVLFNYAMTYFGIARLYYRWTIFPYLIYVVLGFIFANNFEKIKKISREMLLSLLILVFLGAIAIYGPYNNHVNNIFGRVSYVYDSIFGLFFILLGIMFTIPKRISGFISWISEKSFGIYLFHYLIIDILFSLITKDIISFPLSIYTFPVIFVFIVLFSVLLYYPIEYLLNYKT